MGVKFLERDPSNRKFLELKLDGETGELVSTGVSVDPKGLIHWGSYRLIEFSVTLNKSGEKHYYKDIISRAESLGVDYILEGGKILEGSGGVNCRAIEGKLDSILTLYLKK